MDKTVYRATFGAFIVGSVWGFWGLPIASIVLGLLLMYILERQGK